MQDTDYGKVNMTVRVHENYLLNQNHYERMLQAANYEEAVRVLSDTIYREGVEEAIRTRDYEPMLMHVLEDPYRWLINEIPNKALAELITLQYAYHNIKVLFKEKKTGQEYQKTLIDLTYYPIYEFRKAVATLNSNILPQEYIDHIRQMDNFYSDTPSVNDIDIFVDRIYQEHLIHLAEQLEDSDVEQWIRRQIDLQNLSVYFRGLVMNRSVNHMQAVLSEHGNIKIEEYVQAMGQGLDAAYQHFSQHPDLRELFTNINMDHKNSLSQLEREIDKESTNVLSAAKMKVFGPLPVLAYIHAIEEEVVNIRLILTGKLNSIDNDIVKERMRLSYAI